VRGQYDDLSFGGGRLSARPSFVNDPADIAGSVEFQLSHNSLFDKRGAELNRLFDMHGCVVLGLNGANRNTFRVAFAIASPVVFLRIVSLQQTEDFDFHPIYIETVKPFLELLVAVSLSDLGHRELSRTVCTENTRPLLVIPGDPQRIFRIAVPGLQIVIADGPVYGLFQVGIACFQSEIPWDVTWTVAAPSPGAAANQTLVLALENIRAANLSVIKF